MPQGEARGRCLVYAPDGVQNVKQFPYGIIAKTYEVGCTLRSMDVAGFDIVLDVRKHVSS